MRFSSTVFLLGFSTCAIVNSVVAAPAAHAVDSVALLKRQDSGNGTDTGSSGSNGTDSGSTGSSTGTIINKQIIDSLNNVSHSILNIPESSSVLLNLLGAFEGVLTIADNPQSGADPSILVAALGQVFNGMVSEAQTLLNTTNQIISGLQNLDAQFQAEGVSLEKEVSLENGSDD